GYSGRNIRAGFGPANGALDVPADRTHYKPGLVALFGFGRCPAHPVAIFDRREGMLHLAAHPALALLVGFLGRAQWIIPVGFIQNTVIGAVLATLNLKLFRWVGFVAKDRLLVPADQRIQLGAIMRGGFGKRKSPNQLAPHVYSDMAFVSKVPGPVLFGRISVGVYLRRRMLF